MKHGTPGHGTDWVLIRMAMLEAKENPHIAVTSHFMS